MKNLLGYAVEKTDSNTIAYKLIGKKATYRLIRNQNNPEYMFAMNSNGNVCGICGNYTFTDKSGELDVAEVLR